DIDDDDAREVMLLLEVAQVLLDRLGSLPLRCAVWGSLDPLVDGGELGSQRCDEREWEDTGLGESLGPVDERDVRRVISCDDEIGQPNRSGCRVDRCEFADEPGVAGESSSDCERADCCGCGNGTACANKPDSRSTPSDRIA